MSHCLHGVTGWALIFLNKIQGVSSGFTVFFQLQGHEIVAYLGSLDRGAMSRATMPWIWFPGGILKHAVGSRAKLGQFCLSLVVGSQ